MKVILASQNQHKLVELSAILSQLGFEIALESEYGCTWTSMRRARRLKKTRF